MVGGKFKIVEGVHFVLLAQQSVLESATSRLTPKRYLCTGKIWQTMYAILIPELNLIFAINDYSTVRITHKSKGHLDHNSWTTTHFRFAEQGGFYDPSNKDENTYRDKRVDAWELSKLIRSGKLRHPPISAGELKSRSKSSPVVKLIALVQIIWFGIQTLFRAIQHFQITALEISVVAFVLCSLWTYIYRWEHLKRWNTQYP